MLTMPTNVRVAVIIMIIIRLTIFQIYFTENFHFPFRARAFDVRASVCERNERHTVAFCTLERRTVVVCVCVSPTYTNIICLC